MQLQMHRQLGMRLCGVITGSICGYFGTVRIDDRMASVSLTSARPMLAQTSGYYQFAV